MRKQNSNSERPQPTLGSLFHRLTDPFRRANGRALRETVEPIGESSPQQTESNETNRTHGRIRRILVAVDASQQGMMTLNTAASLAASMQAELRGLFVEDIDLLRLADLSVAREVVYPSGSSARISPDRMERQLRAQASQARQALTTACQGRRVRWSLDIVRGNVRAEVLTAAADADLLILGKVSRPLVRQVSIGSTARAAIHDSPSSILLTHRGQRIHSPVVAMFHDSPCGQRTLAMAIHLAQRTGGRLTVLVTSKAAGQTARQSVGAQKANLGSSRKLMVRYRHLPNTSVAAVQQVIHAEAAGIVVLGECSLPLDDIERLAESAQHSVMLIR